jgi:Bacteriocin-protection, YdeI or OmpD-Associated/Domain of unknown function (DUF1905)
MGYFTHRFETTLQRHALGTLWYTVVFLDPALHAELPLTVHPRLRIEAEVGGVPVKGAWQPVRGRWYLMLPRKPLKELGLAVGDSVDVAFRVLPQTSVDIPDELAARLAAVKRLRAAWDAHTPGTQRGLAHFVASAKRAPTRAERLAKVEAALLGKAPLPWSRER